VLLAWNGETLIVIEAKLFFCLVEKSLELRAIEEGNRDNISASVFSDVDNEVTFGDVQAKAMIVFPA